MRYTFLQRIKMLVCNIFGHFPKNKWEYNGMHATCRCCCKVINFEDGKSQEKSIGASSPSAKDLNQDQLVDLVLKQLGQTYRPYRPTGYIAHASQGPYSCGICAGPHKTEMCNSYMPGANNTQG